MRGDIVYYVYGVHAGRDEDVYFGAFRTVFEAEGEIEKLKAREMNGRNWAEQHHNNGFIIREVVVETDFEVPTRPAPRDKYFVKVTAKTRPGGHGTGASSRYFAETYPLEAQNGSADTSAITRCSRRSNPFVRETANSL
jgi:hypothetical protein